MLKYNLWNFQENPSSSFGEKAKIFFIFKITYSWTTEPIFLKIQDAQLQMCDYNVWNFQKNPSSSFGGDVVTNFVIYIRKP